jgi:hypothetical protein
VAAGLLPASQPIARSVSISPREIIAWPIYRSRDHTTDCLLPPLVLSLSFPMPGRAVSRPLSLPLCRHSSPISPAAIRQARLFPQLMMTHANGVGWRRVSATLVGTGPGWRGERGGEEEEEEEEEAARLRRGLRKSGR